MRYSLATYKMTITSPDATINEFLGVGGQGLTIGGQGTQLGSISIGYDKDQWTMKTYATGGYVHEKSLCRSGTVTINLNQLSPQISVLKNVCGKYFTAEDYGGLTISVTTSSGEEVAQCVDCYIQSIPEQSFGESASDQQWSFLCGEITF